jgi:sugar phosphate isomerase/epimerase
MTDSTRSRRDFLKAAGVAGAAGVTGGVLPATMTGCAPESPVLPAGGIKLGVASYSLRELNREDAIAAINAIPSKYVSVKSFHLPYESTAEEIVSGCQAFADAGIEIVGGGVITLQEDNDENMRPYFDYARACGMPLMVIAPSVETMPRIERFVQEYDIKVAIHNHGPEDQYFPGPRDALPVIGDMDPRVGLCVDLGHTTRTGVDIVEAIAEAGDRVLDVHVKDLRDLMDKDSQCSVGEGAMPMTAIFQQLVDMGYEGYVNLEYEINANDPLPGIKQSFAYMRGVLVGMGLQEIYLRDLSSSAVTS